MDLHRVGAVTAATGTLPLFVAVDGAGVEVESVTRYLRDLALSDMSPLACRSYGYDLLRWFRVLWALGSAGSGLPDPRLTSSSAGGIRFNAHLDALLPCGS